MAVIPAVSTSSNAMPFYRFVEHRFWVGAGQEVGVYPADALGGLLSETQLTKAFGKLLLYEDAGKRAYIGVWGALNIERLLKVLTALAPSITIMDEPPARLNLTRRVG